VIPDSPAAKSEASKVTVKTLVAARRGAPSACSSGLGQTNRALSRAHGHATADPTVANGTDTQSVIR
jgi:hypothetical protein